MVNVLARYSTVVLLILILSIPTQVILGGKIGFYETDYQPYSGPLDIPPCPYDLDTDCCLWDCAWSKMAWTKECWDDYYNTIEGLKWLYDKGYISYQEFITAKIDAGQMLNLCLDDADMFAIQCVMACGGIYDFPYIE